MSQYEKNNNRTGNKCKQIRKLIRLTALLYDTTNPYPKGSNCNKLSNQMRKEIMSEWVFCYAFSSFNQLSDEKTKKENDGEEYIWNVTNQIYVIRKLNAPSKDRCPLVHGLTNDVNYHLLP